MEGRGGSESTRGSVDVKELREIWRCKSVKGLEGEEQHFEVDALLNGEPMELLENRSDMINERSSGDDTGG